MRFIVDAQLPALAEFIQNSGHEAVHVAALGLADASDKRIWQTAIQRGAAIITKDEDFSRLRAMRGTGPAIVWVRIGNSRRDVLLQGFAKSFAEIMVALESGNAVVEVRKG